MEPMFATIPHRGSSEEPRVFRSGAGSWNILRRVIFILAVLLASLVHARAAQVPAADPPESTLNGVYTQEQAQSGEVDLRQHVHGLP